MVGALACCRRGAAGRRLLAGLPLPQRQHSVATAHTWGRCMLAHPCRPPLPTILAYCRNQYEVVAIDLPGYGESSKPQVGGPGWLALHPHTHTLTH